jgi:RNA polymerase sigma-70 factor (ECF subfamily)
VEILFFFDDGACVFRDTNEKQLFQRQADMTNIVEDMLLILEFKRGSPQALQRIYEKYVAHLVTVAAALLNDVSGAEDIVHDFFVSFGQSADKLRIQGRLRAYLTTCVTNLVRDNMRKVRRQSARLDEAVPVRSSVESPERSAVRIEQQEQLSAAISKLPYEQREALILHLQGGLMFKQIGRLQQVSTNTACSRYRCALKKLRLQLDGEMTQ